MGRLQDISLLQMPGCQLVRVQLVVEDCTAALTATRRMSYEPLCLLSKMSHACRHCGLGSLHPEYRRPPPWRQGPQVRRVLQVAGLSDITESHTCACTAGASMIDSCTCTALCLPNGCVSPLSTPQNLWRRKGSRIACGQRHASVSAQRCG